MEYLIFYKKDVDIKTTVKEVIFSRKSPYTMAFAKTVDQLLLQLRRYPDSLLYYFTDQISVQDRVLLSKLKDKYPKSQICLCSEVAYAIDAWRLQLFHFLEYPIQASHLKTGFQRYLSQRTTDEQVFTLKSRDGLFKVPFNQVSYISAEGNYTDFYTKSGKRYTQIGKLKEWEYATEIYRPLQRLHRSYIFNLSAIKKLGKGVIEFYGDARLENMSDKLIRKIKVELLGNG